MKKVPLFLPHVSWPYLFPTCTAYTSVRFISFRLSLSLSNVYNYCLYPKKDIKQHILAITKMNDDANPKLATLYLIRSRESYLPKWWRNMICRSLVTSIFFILACICCPMYKFRTNVKTNCTKVFKQEKERSYSIIQKNSHVSLYRFTNSRTSNRWLLLC